MKSHKMETKMKKMFHKNSTFPGRARAFCILHSAFTLIEILIAMVVIAVLVSISIPVSKYVAFRARLANQRVYIEKIKSALEDYRAAYGEYPITPTALDPDYEVPSNYVDVLRHYDLSAYLTECYSPTGKSLSSFTNVNLTTSTVETMEVQIGPDSPTVTRKVDYCLTYPLMIKQRLKGARPFMEFKDITVLYYVYNPNYSDVSAGGDVVTVTRMRKTAGGEAVARAYQGIYGNPINRPEAIDPVSQKQWKYICTDGMSYILTNHNEEGF